MPDTSRPPTALRAPTIEIGLVAGDRPRTPFSTAPVAALAIDVARFRIGVSIADGDTEPANGLLPACCVVVGTCNCLEMPERGGVETALFCKASESAAASILRSRWRVPAAGGVLGRFDPIEELLDNRLGPLAPREEDDDDEGVFL